MAVAAQCQVPLTFFGKICSIWGAVWQHGHLCTAGIRCHCQAGIIFHQATELGSWGVVLSGLISILINMGKGALSRTWIFFFLLIWSQRQSDTVAVKVFNRHFGGYDRLYFIPVNFWSGSSLCVVTLVYKQLSSSVPLCSCLCLRWGSVIQAEGDEKEDSNQSEQGSSLLLSCRLAYFNNDQAVTYTEDGFSVYMWVWECVCVWEGVS